MYLFFRKFLPPSELSTQKGRPLSRPGGLLRNVIALFHFVGSENPCIYSVPNRKQSYLRGIYISCFLRDAICDFSFPRIPSMYANHADMPPNMTTKMPLIVLSQILFQFKTNHLRPKSIFHIINKPIKINTANKIEPIEARNNPNL